MDRNKALDAYVHTPAELASGYSRFAQDIKGDPGVAFGCAPLDKAIIPVRAGRTLGLLAEPGHGKTTVGAAMLINEALRIKNLGLADKYYAAHISWEQPVEELEAMYQAGGEFTISDVAWGRVPASAVVRSSLDRPTLPVWILGDSIYKTNWDTPPLTMEHIYDSVRGVEEAWGLLPSVLFLDYIQDVPVPHERDRYGQVSSAMRNVRRLGIQAKCPVIIGIQASRKTGEHSQPIPTLRDAEWSNVIGQKLDTLVALWRPIKDFRPSQKQEIEIGGNHYPNTDNLLVVKLLKQRFESGSGIFAVHFNPATMEFREHDRPYASDPSAYRR